jgi:CTP:molybdopterin cytidylyltransferase MocA
VHQERRGHPVLFPWSLAAAVDGLSADEGVNALLQTRCVVEVPIETHGILEDIDEREEYERQIAPSFPALLPRRRGRREPD